ncbi:MAG TPA: hypothetical protein PLU35_00835 [Phycisphaerales bacterium]|nr:hypothetical protein [Phycisphaerales bacterium]
MISIARRLASNAFGIGIAIGLLFCLHLQPIALAQTRPDDHPACNGGPSAPPEVQEWVDLHCQIHQALFADAAEPSAAYAINTPIQGTGYYAGVNHEGREVEFEAIWVVQGDVGSVAPELAAQGVTCHLVIGRLSAEAGQVPIAGMVVRPMGFVFPEEEYVLFVGAILSEAELEVFAEAARITSGVRVTDASTLSSTPLAMATSAEVMWVQTSDMSTVFRDGGSVPGVDMACVQRAYRAYNIAVSAANAAVASCMTDAMITFSICMAVCAGSAFLPGVGWVWTAICAGACLANQARQMATCVVNLNIALEAAKQNLILALQACGMNIGWE